VRRFLEENVDTFINVLFNGESNIKNSVFCVEHNIRHGARFGIAIYLFGIFFDKQTVIS